MTLTVMVRESGPGEASHSVQTLWKHLGWIAEEDLADDLVMGVARLDLLRQGVNVAEAALEDATDAHVGTDAQKQTNLRLEAQMRKAHKAALPDPRAAPH